MRLIFRIKLLKIVVVVIIITTIITTTVITWDQIRSIFNTSLFGMINQVLLQNLLLF